MLWTVRYFVFLAGLLAWVLSSYLSVLALAAVPKGLVLLLMSFGILYAVVGTASILLDRQADGEDVAERERAAADRFIDLFEVAQLVFDGIAELVRPVRELEVKLQKLTNGADEKADSAAVQELQQRFDDAKRLCETEYQRYYRSKTRMMAIRFAQLHLTLPGEFDEPERASYEDLKNLMAKVNGLQRRLVPQR
jgi:hypothetical protein